MKKPSMQASVVIPAYNEAKRLPRTLRRFWRTAQKLNLPIVEYLIVDDGSTDQTHTVVDRLRRHKREVKIIRLPHNLGKGGAVKAGALAARGDLIIILDADGSADLKELPAMITALQKKSIVIGSRYVSGSQIVHRQPWSRRLISRGGNWLIRRLLLPGIYDTQCGCKLMTREAAQKLFPLLTRNGFSYDVELLVLAHRHGYTIIEQPITWSHASGTSLHASVDSWRFLQDVWQMHREYRLKADKLL
jgi:dolichyl-phosphate beta-glucosyltransferase